MRTYGRIYDANGVPTWVEVSTTPDGYDDYVWITTLIQNFKLNLNESPYYAQNGIAAKQSVVTQVSPDFDIIRIQQAFAPKFASLIISKEPSPTPTYLVNLTTNQGVKLNMKIAT